ncbi:MAG: four helix bundle protein [candidate division Zixibacteria bacterium]|nr:four helix bundle protein [candidate division Zixibacteria bacterium]
MGYKRFEDLWVWQKTKDLTIRIYETTKKGGLARDYSLVTQIGRSSISIPCNIAEDFERGSKKEFVQFLYIAKASAGELRSQLLIASELGYLEEKISNELKAEAIDTSEQLGALITALKSNIKG